MNVFNAQAYRECLNTARNDLADVLSERYALCVRLDEAGHKLTQLRLRLGAIPKPEKLSQLRKVKGLTRAVEEYCAVLARFHTTNIRIEQLQTWIREVYIEHREVPDDDDLKETICIALRFAGRELTIPVIVRTIQRLQFPIHQQQDPLREVLMTVVSLMAEGKVIAGKPWGAERTYELRPAPFLLRSLARLNQVLRKKEIKKRA